jgi:hypothetical protein
MEKESYASFPALRAIAKDLLVVENKCARLSTQRLIKMCEMFSLFLSTQFVGVRRR